MKPVGHGPQFDAAAIRRSALGFRPLNCRHRSRENTLYGDAATSKVGAESIGPAEGVRARRRTSPTPYVMDIRPTPAAMKYGATFGLAPTVLPTTSKMVTHNAAAAKLHSAKVRNDIGEAAANRGPKVLVPPNR